MQGPTASSTGRPWACSRGALTGHVVIAPAARLTGHKADSGLRRPMRWAPCMHGVVAAAPDGAPGGGSNTAPPSAPAPPPPASSSDALAAKLAAAKAYKAAQAGKAAAAPPPTIDGSAATAAAFLAGTSDVGLARELLADPSLRLEDVSRLRDAEARERGADLITARPGAVIRRGVAAASDEEAQEATATAVAAAAAAAATEEEVKTCEEPSTSSSPAPGGEPPSPAGAYKPKVSTWGVFERPSNISEAYGGGRTIKPGQALETPEEAAARSARTAALLAQFKAANGLDSLDPAEVAAAEDEYAAGMRLLRRGDLAAASEVLGSAAGRLPRRSRTAGLASLNQAIADDSLGRRDAAYSAYKRLALHPTGEVAKKAKQMLFGFAAAKNLKVDTIAFDGGRAEAFQRYMTAMESKYNLLPYLPEGEPDPEVEAAARVATVLAVAAAFAPVAAFGVYVLVRNGGGG
jgi:hypothetical protein